MAHAILPCPDETATQEVIKLSTFTEEGLYLAFDSNCATCQGISSRVQKSAKGRLTARPLNDPDVMEARREIFGAEPPHKPTLMRVKNGDIQAWTGPSMGWILTKELGTRDTLSIIQALGIERQSGHRMMIRPAIEKRLSRRKFGQVAAGLAAAVSVFTTGSLTSAAFAKGFPEAGEDLEMSDDEAQLLFEEALTSEEWQGIAPEGAVDRLAGGDVTMRDELAAPSRFIELSNAGSTDMGDGVVVPGDGVLAVFSSKLYGDGTSSKTVAIALSSAHLLTYVTEEAGERNASGAELFEMNPESGGVSTLAVAAGGKISEPVPDGAITTRSSDPCGGCAGTNMQLSSACKSKDQVQCALSAVTCTGCVSACAVINTGCISCVVGTCGNALRTCCEDGSVQICKPCKILP